MCSVMGQGVGGVGETLLLLGVFDCVASGLRGGCRNEGDVIPAPPPKYSVDERCGVVEGEEAAPPEREGLAPLPRGP